MKKLLYSTMLFAGILSVNEINAQDWNTAGNNTFPTDYLGTNNNRHLRLRTNTFERMKIRNGGTGNTAGRIAMGNNLPNGFTPTARLHLHQNGGFTNLRFTTDGTGNTANDGFSMGMANNGNAAFINHEFGGNFTWFNQGNGPGTLLNRMILFDGGSGNNTGRMALGDDLPNGFNATSRLHLHQTGGNNRIQFTNNTTGLNGVDGFQVGINNTGVALIRQQEDEMMRFYTNDIHRLKIENGGNSIVDGRVTIGNDLPNNFIPRARLHLHQIGNVNGFANRNMIKFTSNRTGNGPSDGFEVGYNSQSPILNRQFAEIRNFENSAIKFFTTAGSQRMHINQSRSSQLGLTNLKYSVPTGGYVGIGRNTSNIWGNANSIGRGPYSLLHLNNDRGTAEQAGYRPWMRGGITFTENVDLAYVGFRPFFDGSGNYNDANLIENENEFTIAWSNNPTVGPQGSDDMVFRFITNTTGALQNTISNDLTTARDFDGLHIARFTALGNMGLGPTFGQNNPQYVLPQSLMHISRNDTLDTWYQATNQFGTGQTATDGLRMGVTNAGTAHIKQQEDLPLIFYTGNIEDARIEPTSASTLPGNHGMIGLGNYSATGPNTAAADVVDAKLDIDGDLRIRQVTEDTNLVQVLVIDSNDLNRVHWRSITDFGNGLACWDLNGNGIQDPNEDINGDTFFDALDCQGAVGLQGPIGLAGAAGAIGPAGTPGAMGLPGVAGPQGSIGLTGPMGLAGAMGLPGIPGSVGPIGPAGIAGTNGIDGIDGIDGAIGPVGPAGPPGGGGATADNGLSINPANNVQMGQIYTGTPANTGIGEFIHNTEVPLNNFNLHFTNVINAGTPGFNRVSFGKPVSLSGLTETAKVYAFNGDENSAIMGHTDGNLLPTSLSVTTAGVTGILENIKSEKSAGVYGFATTSTVFDALGVLGEAVNSPRNTGVQGLAIDNAAQQNIGGEFTAVGASVSNVGAFTRGVSGPTLNIGTDASASGPLGSTNYAIFAEISSGSLGTNFAGFFTGNVDIIGDLVCATASACASDNMFKTNQQSITNATSIINQLTPKSYNLDSANYTQFGFDTKQHLGLIAQEVEQILPNLVLNSVMPAQFDDNGVQTSPRVDYKALKYQEFIPLLIAGMQEQQSGLNAKDSVINNLATRLAVLEECLANTGICNGNGHGNNGDGNDNGNRIESPSIELNNLNAIILDQNLPNPFAEKTTINYTIPEEVSEAQLMFSDVNGRIIKQVEINERGEGSLTVYGENLEKGIYTYSLIADGKLIATKKMVKQ